MRDATEQSRATVLRLFQYAMSGRVADALSLVHEDYVEHNPGIGSGRADLEVFLRGLTGGGSAPKIEIQRVIAEGRHVVVHLHTLWADRPATNAIDIFEVGDGLITEHWDVVQTLTE